MKRFGLVRLSGAVLLGCGASAVLAISPASASELDPADSRAVAHEGNATTCEDAGLPGEVIEVGSESDGTMLTVTDVPDGFTLTGVVIKGGPAYNVYPPDALVDLHSPLNRGGNIPQISHWFACAVASTETTAPNEPEPTGTTPVEEPSDSPTPEESSPAEEDTANASDDSDLAETGFNSGVALGVALLLLVAGAVLVVGPTRVLAAVSRRR